MVLGNWTRKDTLYGGEGYSVIGNGELAQQLEGSHRPLAGIRTAASIAGRGQTGPHFTPPPPERHITEGSFFVGEIAVICQSQGGQGRARRLWRHDAEGRRHA